MTSSFNLDFDFGVKQEDLVKIQRIITNTTQRKYLIDGNIGAGKTTLVKLLETYLNKQGIKAKAILEPVDIWRETEALQYFYGDIALRSYEFQTFTFITRIKRVFEDILANPDAEVYLFERHIWSDRYIFGALLKEQFGPVKLRMYEMWWDMWSYIFPLKPTKWVLLDTDVETAYERIGIRNRGEEKSGVSKDYLAQLHQKHHEFYDALVDKNEKTQIITSELMSNNFIENESDLHLIASIVFSD
jgi:deoxyguanosine kinase